MPASAAEPGTGFARASIAGDTLAITGVGGPLQGGRFDSRGDHRMAMSAAVAALAARPGERSLITGFGAVETSYPTFADGPDEMLVNDAIAESARLGRWVEVVREPVAVGVESRR